MASERAKSKAYRAIGRYVVEFSQLVMFMRFMLAERLHRPEDGTGPVELALGEATANQVANAFFATCQEVGELDTAETKIVRSLRARVLQQIEKRNDVAHGDWYIEDERVGPSTLIRTKPAKADGTLVIQDVAADDLDRWSEELHDLAFMIMRLGGSALGIDAREARVGDLFVIKDKRVIWRALAP